MAAISYGERLRDPRWQRKRLEVMERDGWQCRRCNSRERTLNVHHRYYRKGRSPWEYPDWALLTLCGPCHECNSEDTAAAELIERICAAGGEIGQVNDLFAEMAHRGVTIEGILCFVRMLPSDAAERTLAVIQRAFLDDDSPQRERIVRMIAKVN